MKRFNCLLLTVILLLSGCSSETSVTPDEVQVVLRGYLFADEPVEQIQLSSTLYLGDEDTLAPPVNDAEVVLIKDGISYQLEKSDGDSGYYHYAGNNLSVGTNDIFRIEIEAEGQKLTAETIVPAPPTDLVLSKNEIEYVNMRELFENGAGMEDMETLREEMSLDAAWQGDADAMYYVSVENIEANPVEIDSETGMMRPPGLMISRPTTNTNYEVNVNSLTHYGLHRITVYRINAEYADLYQSRNQDSRDLNEPASNVNGGLGVFSAFNSCSGVFEVK